MFFLPALIASDINAVFLPIHVLPMIFKENIKKEQEGFVITKALS